MSINCVNCGAKLVSLSDLTEHLLIDHQGECLKCDGWGTVEDKHDPDRVEKCPNCHGSGRLE